MTYEVGQVFKGKNYCFEIVSVFDGSYIFKDKNGFHFSVKESDVDSYLSGNGVSLETRSDDVAKPFKNGDEVFTKNRAYFVVVDYDCPEGYLRGKSETGSLQILKISGLEKYDSASDTETEVEDEMVSLNEVCQVLADNNETYLAGVVLDYFAEKKKKLDPEYQEYLRLKEKFGQ